MRRLVLALILLLAACGRTAPEPPPPPTGAQMAFIPAPTFGDLDPHDWTGKRPDHYPVHGIDVARYQGAIDWAQVRRAGVSFAYLKATEGGDVLDPTFADNRRGAQRAGLRWGAYHYFYFCRPAADQARWFIRHVPRDSAAMPHVLDMEWNHRSPTCKLRPDGAKVRREARIFLDMLEQHYGRRPILYTTPDFFRDTGIGKLGGTQFWLRSVAGHPSETYPSTKWTFWQYTGTGVVPGIAGPVDINAFFGTHEQWFAWQI